MVGIKALFLQQPPSYQRKDAYRMGKELGQGADGVVRQAQMKDFDGPSPMMHVAVKIVLKKKVGVDGYRERLSVLKTFNHPHLARLHDYFESRTKFFAVYEYAACGDLFDMIIHRGHYNEPEAQAVTRSLLDAVTFLHDNHIVHRDIKPENIFLRSTQRGDVVLGDFELAVRLSDDDDLLEGVAGTVGYSSPEAILGRPHNKATDIWSVGIVTFVLLAGRLPYASPYPDDIMDEMKQLDLRSSRFDYVWPDFPTEHFQDTSDFAKDFILSCVEYDKARRLTAHAALEHYWVKDVSVLSTFQQVPNTVTQNGLIEPNRDLRGVPGAPDAPHKPTSPAISRYATTGSTAACSIRVVQVDRSAPQTPRVAPPRSSKDGHTSSHRRHHHRHHRRRPVDGGENSGSTTDGGGHPGERTSTSHRSSRNGNRGETASDESDHSKYHGRKPVGRRRKTDLPLFAGMML